MKKKAIKYGILLVVLFVIFLLIYIFTFKNKTLLNKSVEIKEIKFSHVKIKKTTDGYSFNVYVTAMEESTDLDGFDAIIRNKKGDMITTLSSRVGGLKKGQYKYITIETKENLDKAYSVSYTIYRK